MFIQIIMIIQKGKRMDIILKYLFWNGKYCRYFNSCLMFSKIRLSLLFFFFFCKPHHLDVFT